MPVAFYLQAAKKKELIEPKVKQLGAENVVDIEVNESNLKSSIYKTNGLVTKTLYNG